jgi:hypothetical protein
MTWNKFGSTAAAVALTLLAAGTSPAGAIVKTIRTFQPVTVTPAHVSAQPAAIAANFCTKAGYGVAITHTFIGFEIEDGTASALFEQITCNPNIPRPLVFKRAGGLTLGQ